MKTPPPLRAATTKEPGMSRLIFELHILQHVPPNNLNRDDTGSPKTCVYGGVRRARIASQSAKAAARKDFRSKMDERHFGLRTRRAVDLIADEITAADPELRDRAGELAQAVFVALGIKTTAADAPPSDEDGAPTARARGGRQRAAASAKAAASPAAGTDPAAQGGTEAAVAAPLPRLEAALFLSRPQISALAAAARDVAASAAPAAELKKRKIRDLANVGHSVDIALHGRMVAAHDDLQVDAACQVAHAIGVDAVDVESDYFTAQDEYLPPGETGAAMVQTADFSSSTFYRHAVVDVNRLAETLEDPEVTRRAVEGFLDSFIRTLPGGKENAFAHHTRPFAVVLIARDSQSINFAEAFHQPVRPNVNRSYAAQACEALRDCAQDIHRTFGETPLAAWVLRTGRDTDALDDLGEPITLPDMITAAGNLVTARIGGTV